MILDHAKTRALAARLAAPYRNPSTGVAVAIASPDDVWFEGFDRIDGSNPNPPDDATLFEIGSITKVFTSILLARLVLGGLIGLDTPIRRIAPELSTAPDWITPRTLATHTSGLPRLPVPLWKLPFMSAENPYAAISGRDLADWLERNRPARPPKPGRVRYSNLGVGMLGHALGVATGLGYAEALRQHVLKPLGLDDTVIELSPEHRRRLATPHRKPGRPTPPWDFDALAGAGALRSTARDLVTFGRAVILASRGAGPLAEALAMTLELQVPLPPESTAGQCLGWVKLQPDAGQPPVYFHDGGTLGSSSAFYVAPEPGLVMAVLANRGHNIRMEIGIARSKPLDGVRELGGGASAAP